MKGCFRKNEVWIHIYGKTFSFLSGYDLIQISFYFTTETEKTELWSDLLMQL